jgi:hypothetical protein
MVTLGPPGCLGDGHLLEVATARRFPGEWARHKTALDAFECLQASGPDRVGERLIVPLVLIGVALGEVSDGPVELVALAQVGGGRDGVAGAGVRPAFLDARMRALSSGSSAPPS